MFTYRDYICRKKHNCKLWINSDNGCILVVLCTMKNCEEWHVYIRIATQEKYYIWVSNLQISLNNLCVCRKNKHKYRNVGVSFLKSKGGELVTNDEMISLQSFPKACHKEIRYIPLRHKELIRRKDRVFSFSFWNHPFIFVYKKKADLFLEFRMWPRCGPLRSTHRPDEWLGLREDLERRSQTEPTTSWYQR